MKQLEAGQMQVQDLSEILSAREDEGQMEARVHDENGNQWRSSWQ